MFLEEAEYQYIINLMSGKEKPYPLLAELKEWYVETFQMEMYDYICDYTITGLNRLKIVLWNHEEEKKMHKKDANLDPKKQDKIRNKFAELARKYQLHKEYWDADDIFVCYDTICDEIQKRILYICQPKIERIKHRDIWKIEIIFSGIHIFYETDEQIISNQANGVSKKIHDKCTEIVKKYEEFNVFPNGVNCTFTSHQTLDEKYAGSMFYYTR